MLKSEPRQYHGSDIPPVLRSCLCTSKTRALEDVFMNFIVYLFLRFCYSAVGKTLGAILILPVLILLIPVFIVISPFAWAWDVYDEWKELPVNEDQQ